MTTGWKEGHATLLKNYLSYFKIRTVIIYIFRKIFVRYLFVKSLLSQNNSELVFMLLSTVPTGSKKHNGDFSLN